MLLRSFMELQIDRPDGGDAGCPRALLEGLLDATFAAGAVVLRNSGTLPEKTTNDVDLLVAPAQVDRVEAAVRTVASAHGWRILGVVNKRGYRGIWLIDPSQTVVFPVDCFSFLGWRGLGYAAVVDGLASKFQTPAGVWSVGKGFEAAVTFCKELVAWGRLKTHARCRVSELAREDEAGFIGALSRAISSELARELWCCCAREEWDHAERLGREIRAALLRRVGPRSLLSVTAHLFIELRHHRRGPLSLVVAFVGPDGSGKTTVTDRIERDLHRRPFQRVIRRKIVMGVLPRLGAVAAKLSGASKSPEPIVRVESEERPQPAWKAVLYQLYYLMDLTLGRLLLFRWRGQTALVIFDRSFADYHFLRSHLHVPSWVTNTLEFAAPRPDLLIYLDRDPNEIHRSKAELTVAEIVRQKRIIETRMSGRNNFVRISGDSGAERSIAEVRATIMAKLLERNSSSGAAK